MRRTVGRIAVLALALVVVAPGSALAADPAPEDALGLSTSRHGPWANRLTDPLFPATRTWVPGDVETAGFWARNQSRDTTELRLRVLPRVTDLRARDGGLDVHVRLDGGVWRPLGSSWTTPTSLSPGERTHVQIRADLPRSTTNAVQGLEYAFDVSARLTYTGPDAKAPGTVPEDDERPSGWLPRTGAGLAVAVLWLAVLLIAVGSFVLAVLRRRDKEPEHV